MIRKLTLEQRIARLERAVRNEARSKNFEANGDAVGARAAADRIAKQFASMTGAKLTYSGNSDIIDSPSYGATSDVEVLNDDPDARFRFHYDVDGWPADDVVVCPSDNTVCVWRSVYNGYEGEGAVDPNSGYCEWCDWLDECSYPLAAWKNFSFDMIHGDDYDESLKRRSARRCESRRNSRR
jgi:hypothetical protein